MRTNPDMQELSQACTNSVPPFDNFLSSFFGKAGTTLEHLSYDSL